jgi:hypothetical protein
MSCENTNDSGWKQHRCECGLWYSFDGDLKCKSCREIERGRKIYTCSSCGYYEKSTSTVCKMCTKHSENILYDEIEGVSDVIVTDKP